TEQDERVGGRRRRRKLADTHLHLQHLGVERRADDAAVEIDLHGPHLRFGSSDLASDLVEFRPRGFDRRPAARRLLGADRALLFSPSSRRPAPVRRRPPRAGPRRRGACAAARPRPRTARPARSCRVPSSNSAPPRLTFCPAVTNTRSTTPPSGVPTQMFSVL